MAFQKLLRLKINEVSEFPVGKWFISSWETYISYPELHISYKEIGYSGLEVGNS